MNEEDDIYPVGPGDRRINVRLSEEQARDIELMVEVWNALDKALGRKSTKKWKPTSVIDRLIEVGIKSFWKQVGGQPKGESQAELVKRVVADVKKQSRK